MVSTFYVHIHTASKSAPSFFSERLPEKSDPASEVPYTKFMTLTA
jgi:hypothetical protein